MDLFEAIERRRSIKPEHMKPDPVDRAVIQQLLRCANWAPSHGQTEPWRFVVFTGSARTRLAEVVAEAEADTAATQGASASTSASAKGNEAKGNEVSSGLGVSALLAADDPRRTKILRKMQNAPVVIAIVCAPASSPKVELHEEIASVAMAVHNFHLGARALGLGAFWSSGKKAFHPRVAEFLNITAPARCLGFLFVGWPSVPWPEGERRPVEDKITWRGDEELSF